ncbi:hypothetical protein L6164_018406 [Bauhinia variegata]|nr:hypothetical protein L6164_018406 [Bauhinia variegata]
MFPTGGKKRGCAFENPEPSSPKVTCIGQVRVKTKKQGRKMRTRSMRRGEASFRKTEQNFQVSTANPDLNQQNGQAFQYQNYQNLQQECLPHRNQRWVHLPLTICEALKAFGAEFNCFFPCRSSCMSSERGKEERSAGVEGSSGGNGRESSCGDALAKWLVALQEGDAKSSEIELVVGEEETTDRLERSHRRHVFEDIDINIEKSNEEFNGEEEDKARVSICIPPKNALLLMRCRSDPVKMAALANRFFESPAPKDEDEDVNGDDGEDNNREHMEEDEEEEEEEKEKIEVPLEVACEERVIPEAEVEAKPVTEEYEIESRANQEINGVSEASQERQSEEKEEEKEEGAGSVNEEDESGTLGVSSPEAAVDLDKLEIEEVQPKMTEDSEEKLKEEENNEDDHNEQKSSELASSSAVSAESESENNEAAAAVMDEASTEAATEESKEVEEKASTERPWEDEETATHDRSDRDDPKLYEQTVGPESKEREHPTKPENKGSSVLPDCLLLMMCEPKLSMEVSKETWVCSTDFIRWLPEKPVKKKDGGDQPKKRISIDSKPPLPPHMLQPPRSSCSFPAAAAPMSMATMIEQKLVGSKPNAYEPFVLTRCKSEPMRSLTEFAPEACFWKNRKLEPHHPPATFGVGAAGVGF